MKNLLTLLCCMFSLTASAQTQINNNSFENWQQYPNGAWVPQGFYSTDGMSFDGAHKILPSTDAHSGQYSALIQTRCDTISNFSCDNIELHYPQGSPFTGRPSRIKFWYKMVSTPGSAVGVATWLSGSTAGAHWADTGNVSSWTQAVQDFHYYLSTPVTSIWIYVQFNTFSGWPNDTTSIKLWIDDIEFEYANDIGEPTQGTLVKLSPNPTTGTFKAELPKQEEFNINVMDLSGKLVHQSNGCGGTVIDCSTWARGIYVVQLVTNERTYIEKLYLQH